MARALHVVEASDEPFPAMLRGKRERDGLTQAQLGALLESSQQRVAAWERGQRPTEQFYEALVGFLGLKDTGGLVRLLDQLPMQKAVATSALRTREGDLSAAEAEAMLQTLGQIYAERAHAMSDDERRSHRLLVEYYTRVAARTPAEATSHE